jgi:hypothetical protein
VGGDFDASRRKATGGLEVVGESRTRHVVQNAAIPRVAGNDRYLADIKEPAGYKQ